MVKKRSRKEFKFEEALASLERIVDDLERGDIALDVALKRYTEGVRIASECTEKLDQTKRKIELLVKSSKGAFKTVPFDDLASEEESI